MAVTQLTGIQVKDATVGIADLSATGTPSATTYHRGDNTWASVTAAPPDIATSLLTPTISETILTNTSGYVSGFYAITGVLNLTIQGNGQFRIG